MYDFVEIHELQTELSVFEATGVTNFGTWCTYIQGCSGFHYFKSRQSQTRPDLETQIRLEPKPHLDLGRTWFEVTEQYT